MAYWDVSQLAIDQDFIARVTACYQTEVPTDTQPMLWTNSHAWQMAAAPGFGDKYAYAVATGVEHPGRAESVISDADLLSAVQAVMAQNPAP